MRLLLAFLIAAIAFSASAETYTVNRMIKEKRAEAARQRAESLQRVEQRRQNPYANFDQNSGVPQEISFKAEGDGHFYIPAQVNNSQIRFLADTGASQVFLTQDDARKAGIDIGNLNYGTQFQTANGTAYAASATVKNLRVGTISVDNMPVFIARDRGGISLLGMSFFKRLTKYNVQNDTLTLYK